MSQKVGALLLLLLSPLVWAQGAVTMGNRDKSVRDPMECLLQPRLESNIGSPVEGVIRKVLVDRGRLVSAGQPLVELESHVEQAAVSLKQAQEDFGNRRIARNKDLFDKSLLSEGERDEIVTQTELARLERAHQQALLEQKTIRAPFAGLVVERYLSPGDRVLQEKILKLVQLDPLNVELIVPARLMGQIRAGMQARVSHPEFIPVPALARVEVVDRVVDVASSTIGVRLTLPNPGARIPAGIACTLEFKP